MADRDQTKTVSFPHTQHYLSQLRRIHLSPSFSTSSRPSSSVGSYSASASSEDGVSIVGSPPEGSTAAAPQGGAGAAAKELQVKEIVQMIENEDEDALKILLRDGLSMGNQKSDDQTLDTYILQLFHKVKDDSNNVPFSLEGSSTPRRPISSSSSRAGTPTISRPGPSFRPLTPLSHSGSPRPSTTQLVDYPSHLSSSSSAASSKGSPSPKPHHQLPAISSPLSSPKVLSAKAVAFNPSAKSFVPGGGNPLVASVAASDPWSMGGSASPGSGLVRSTSNLAIAAPLYADSPFYSGSADHGGRIDVEDDEEDEFSPFGFTTSGSRQQQQYLPPASILTSSQISPDLSWQELSYQQQQQHEYSSIEETEIIGLTPLEEAQLQAELDLQELEISQQSAEERGEALTPFDVLSSIFTSLSPQVVEEALYTSGYDLEATITLLMAPTPRPSTPSSATLSVPTPNRAVMRSTSSSFLVSGGRGGRGLSPSPSPGPAIGHRVGAVTMPVATSGLSGGRVCRYYLAGECRRADCRFSHDIERALCRFWLRGQCAKGEQCEFIHTLPSNFDPSVLSMAIANAQASSPSNSRPTTPNTPPVDDFPSLSSLSLTAGGSGGRGRVDPARARFSAAVKKTGVVPVNLQQPAGSASRGRMISSSDYHPPGTSQGEPQPRPSPRLALRPPTLLPTLQTGASVNQLYMSTRARSLQLGAARNACLARAADAWRRGDGAAAKRFSLEGSELNARMRVEAVEAAMSIVQERRKLAQDVVRSREGGTREPKDRAAKGKAAGGGLGVILGIRDGQESLAEREEALIDCHGLHGDEACEVLEKFLYALESERFLGLAYAVVGLQRHTGTQDAARGASRIRLGKSVKEWLVQWGYPWSESGGIICIDPLTHFSP